MLPHTLHQEELDHSSRRIYPQNPLVAGTQTHHNRVVVQYQLDQGLRSSTEQTSDSLNDNLYNLQLKLNTLNLIWH